MQPTTKRTNTQTAQRYQEIADKILAALDREIIPWVCPWDRTATNAPRNLINNRLYHGCNIMLLHLETTTSPEWEGCPYWITYRQAKELGGTVRKGEKGTRIYFWKISTRQNNDGETVLDPETGRAKKSFWMQQYTVFNAQQCDNIRWPHGRYNAWKHPKARPQIDPDEAAEAIVSGYPDAPEIVTGYDGRAYYRPSMDYISMPPRDTFQETAGYYQTLFHELGHSTGHESRLNRKEITKNDRSRVNYAREELVAEMTAAFLMTRAGLPLHIDNTASYIDGWRKEISNDPSIVMTAAGRAERAARYILAETADGAPDETPRADARQLALFV